MKGGIIAAGEGSRLHEAFGAPKPLVRVGGMTLLERTLRALSDSGVDEVTLIAREPEVVEHARSLNLPARLRTVIKVTESSMHSLYELGIFLKGERFLLCTVDSIIRPEEFAGFARTFEERTDLDVLLSYTDHIDDEKPLRVAVEQGPGGGAVTALGEAAADSPFVTVGLYGIGPRAMSLLDRALTRRMKKLRNYLALVLENRLPMAGCRLSKAIDVDRPTDVEAAEAFLLEAAR